MTAWWQRLPSAVLEVRPGDRSAGGAGSVSIRYRSRWSRLGNVSYVVVGIAAVWWALFVPGHRNLVFLVPFLVVLNFTVTALRSRKRVALTDQILGAAAVDAASALGTRMHDQSWRVTGVAADSIGRDLVRLHNWWTIGTGMYADPVREQALLDAAGPALRRFLRPTTLSAARRGDSLPEPDCIDVLPHLPGQPWPTMKKTLNTVARPALD